MRWHKCPHPKPLPLGRKKQRRSTWWGRGSGAIWGGPSYLSSVKARNPHDFVEQRNWPCTPCSPLEQLVPLIREYGADAPQLLWRTGDATLATWKLAHGDTRVFSRPKPRDSQLVVMLDLSGSMAASLEGGWRQPNRIAVASGLIAAIAAVHPDMALYGFCSGHARSYIVDLVPNTIPDTSEGNPDCVALTFLQALLGGALAGATALFISDGTPAGPAPLSPDHLITHTNQLACEMHDAGLNLGLVVIGDGFTADYPADVTVKIRVPSDLRKLVGLFEYLEEGR